MIFISVPLATSLTQHPTYFPIQHPTRFLIQHPTYALVQHHQGGRWRVREGWAGQLKTKMHGTAFWSLIVRYLMVRYFIVRFL